MKIEQGIPLPKRIQKPSELQVGLLAMRPGQSFIWSNNRSPYIVAKRLGLKISIRKIDGEGYRVWFVS